MTLSPVNPLGWVVCCGEPGGWCVERLSNKKRIKKEKDYHFNLIQRWGWPVYIVNTKEP